MTLDKSMAKIISLVRFWRLVAWWFQLGPWQMLGKRGDGEIMIIPFEVFQGQKKMQSYHHPINISSQATQRQFGHHEGPGGSNMAPTGRHWSKRGSALNWYPPFPKLLESDQAWIWLVERPIWFGYKVPGLSYLPFHLALASGCTAAAVFADNSPEGWRSDRYKAQGHYGTGGKGTSFLLSVGWIISYYLHSRTEWWPRGFESI